MLSVLSADKWKTPTGTAKLQEDQIKGPKNVAIHKKPEQFAQASGQRASMELQRPASINKTGNEAQTCVCVYIYIYICLSFIVISDLNDS